MAGISKIVSPLIRRVFSKRTDLEYESFSLQCFNACSEKWRLNLLKQKMWAGTMCPWTAMQLICIVLCLLWIVDWRKAFLYLFLCLCLALCMLLLFIYRWLKFEEDVEDGGERWSKPYVATLSLHSLFELRSCIVNGTVMLDMRANSIEEIAGTFYNTCINHILKHLWCL